MTRPYFIYNTFRYIVDAPLIVLSFYISQYISPEISLSTSKPYAYIFILFSIIAWYSVAQISRLYTDLRSKKFSEEIIYILVSLILFAIILTSFLFFFRNNILFTNYFFLIYFSTLFFLTVFFKYLIRKYLHRAINRGKLLEQVLLIGSTAAAKDFYDTINQYYYYGYKCIGFLDDKTIKLNGCKYLGRVKELESVLSKIKVDEVIIALPNSQHESISSSIETCDFHAKRVRIIPDLDFYASSNIQVNNIGLLPVINLRALPQDLWINKMIKRFFDVLFSILFFFVAGCWLMPIIAAVIKLTSKGPVFFKQERWGINNKKIICYKFRTMIAGSLEVDTNGNYMQASRLDSRITKFGKYLRKTNLDELPQFWNVLLGNMSVVGPRPHPTPLNLASIETVDRYMLRHLVKPGITGWAQVNGCRGETQTSGSMQRRVNFDLYYIHRWTFWLDCQIILQTIINIIRGDQNAY